MPPMFESHNECICLPTSDLFQWEPSFGKKSRNSCLNKYIKKESSEFLYSHRPDKQSTTILSPQEINKNGRVNSARQWLRSWINARSAAFTFFAVFSAYQEFCFDSEETPLDDLSFLDVVRSECYELSKGHNSLSLHQQKRSSDFEKESMLRCLIFKSKFLEVIQEDENSCDSGCDSVDHNLIVDEDAISQTSEKDSCYSSDDDSSTNSSTEKTVESQKYYSTKSEATPLKTGSVKSEINALKTCILKSETIPLQTCGVKSEDKALNICSVKSEDLSQRPFIKSETKQLKNCEELDNKSASESKPVAKSEQSSFPSVKAKDDLSTSQFTISTTSSSSSDQIQLNGENGVFRIKRELDDFSEPSDSDSQDTEVENQAKRIKVSERQENFIIRNQTKRIKWSETQEKVIENFAANLELKEFESSPCFKDSKQLSKIMVLMLKSGQLQLFLSTFVHSSNCTEKHPNLCFLFKRIFRHISNSGGHFCAVREVYGHILRLHLDTCKDDSCVFPKCKTLRDQRAEKSSASEE